MFFLLCESVSMPVYCKNGKKFEFLILFSPLSHVCSICQLCSTNSSLSPVCGACRFVEQRNEQMNFGGGGGGGCVCTNKNLRNCNQLMDFLFKGIGLCRQECFLHFLLLLFPFLQSCRHLKLFVSCQFRVAATASIEKH